MKKYKLIWFEGHMNLLEPDNVIKTIEAEAESINKVDAVSVLPENERQRFCIEINHGLRIAWESGYLKDAKECVIDYGSYSRFIYIKEIE